MNTYIEDLDAALQESGEDIVLRRMVGTASPVKIDVTCRANTRRVRNPAEGIDGFSQDDVMVIISPTQIAEAQWPGGGLPGSPPFNPDRSIPMKGDQLIIGGRRYFVEAVDAMTAGPDAATVRIEMLAKGAGGA